jgi:hypothetical protein
LRVLEGIFFLGDVFGVADDSDESKNSSTVHLISATGFFVLSCKDENINGVWISFSTGSSTAGAAIIGSCEIVIIPLSAFSFSAPIPVAFVSA